MLMRPMKTSPRRSSAASQARPLPSVSRSHRPFVLTPTGLLGEGRYRRDLDAYHVAHTSASALIEWHDDTQMLGIKRLTVHPLGQDYLLVLELGHDFADCQHRSITL